MPNTWLFTRPPRLLRQSKKSGEVGEIQPGANEGWTPDEGLPLKRAPAEHPEPHRLGQRRVRLRPSPGENPSVVGAAVRRHRRQPSPRRNLPADADPPLGPLNVLRVVPRRKQP